MPLIQLVFLSTFAFTCLFFAIKGLKQSRKGNTNTLTRYLSFMGAFVWADAVIFGLFWFLVSLFCLVTQDWILFWLITSIFWLVRSMGEMIYWFNQQFSTLERNKPENLPLFQFFPNDSIWFVYQIMWQCVIVVTIIISVYLFKLWL